MRPVGAPRALHPVWAAAAAIALLAPFADKAFHMDDPLFLWTARQIQSHPLDPYGFTVNWYGIESPAAEIIKNPPLASYYLALAARVVGFGEPGLHLAMMAAAVVAMLGTWALARRLSPHPDLAAFALLASPVFLVSGSTLMCDVPMLALWVWALELWLEGHDRGRNSALAGAALLATLAALTKYYAIALLPLLAIVSLSRGGSRRPIVWLLIPIATLVLYQMVTRHAYQRGLLSDAAAYATSWRHLTLAALGRRLLTGLTFLGGGLAFPLAFIVWTHRWRAALAIAAAAALLAVPCRALLASYASFDGGPPGALVVQAALMAAAGVVVLGLVAAELWIGRSRDAWVLALWVLGALGFASFVNWTTNGRSILSAAPAVAILVARFTARSERERVARAPWARLAPLAPVVALALAVAWADARFAAASRAAAAAITRDARGAGGQLWYEGHWGFQYYMNLGGARALDFAASRLAPGDRLALPAENTNVNPLPLSALRILATLAEPGPRGLATMSSRGGAGFYADDWGPLPYAFGVQRPLSFAVAEITRPLRLGAR